MTVTNEGAERPSTEHDAAAERPGLIGPGSDLAQRYQVGEAIGRGGMAMVYHGHDTLLDRDVAIKVLGSAAANATGSQQQFLREARAAAALSHPNIVSIYDAGVHGSERYIVMEYVGGGSLFEVIQADAPLPPREAVSIAAQLADALDYGHRRGLVHCDVKPQNVLLDDNGRPKLVDFGISRSIAATGALTDTIAGTAGYIAPEQLLGEQLDGRADVYSLGCLVYEMLSGDLPFEAANLAALATQRLVRPPLPLSRRNPRLPAPLAEAVMHAIEREPDERYASAKDFARSLERGLTGFESQATSRFASPLPQRARPGMATSVVERPVRPAPAREGGRRLFWPLTLMLLGLLVLVGALLAYALPPILNSPSGRLVAVPAVAGQPIDQAAKSLEADGFKVNVVTRSETACPADPTGAILSQSPTAQTQLHAGQQVTLVVTSNPKC